MTEPRQIAPDCRTGYNGTGGVLAKGTIVKRSNAGLADEIVAAAAATDAYMGVCAEDIPNLQRGNVQVSGVAVALAGSTGITKQDRVMWEAGADCVVCTSGNAILGTAVSTAAAGKLFEIELVAGGGGPEMP